MSPPGLVLPARPVDLRPLAWNYLRRYLEQRALGMISWLPSGFQHVDLVSGALERLWWYQRKHVFSSWEELQRYSAQIMKNLLIDWTKGLKKVEHECTHAAVNPEESFADESFADDSLSEPETERELALK